MSRWRRSHRRLRGTRGVTAIDPAKSPPSASRLEQHLADLNRLVGDEAPSWEDLMVEIRVAVDDATRVPGLMRRLARLFDQSSISFDRSRKEVLVNSEWESRGIVSVVDAVARWLAEDDGDTATLSIGNRSYTMAAPARLAADR